MPEKWVFVSLSTLWMPETACRAPAVMYFTKQNVPANKYFLFILTASVLTETDGQFFFVSPGLTLLFICFSHAILPVYLSLSSGEWTADGLQEAAVGGKLREGERRVHSALWSVVWSRPGGVCGTPDLTHVPLPTRPHKLLPQTHAPKGLHHGTAR